MSQTGPSARLRAGFTLLELLIVLAVIGLIAGVAGPRLTRNMGSIETDVAQARDALRRAQITALGQGAVQWVGFQTDPAALVRADGGTTRFPRGTELSLDTAAEAARAGVPGFLFTPDGGSSGGTVRIDRRGRTAGLTVHWATGGIETWSGERP
ncbi:MAG: GspH/FimT family pseudopilin [Maricaulaceae bacterium]